MINCIYPVQIYPFMNQIARKV